MNNETTGCESKFWEKDICSEPSYDSSPRASWDKSFSEFSGTTEENLTESKNENDKENKELCSRCVK